MSKNTTTAPGRRVHHGALLASCLLSLVLAPVLAVAQGHIADRSDRPQNLSVVRTSVRTMTSREDIEVAYKGLDTALEAVAALSYDVLTVTEKKNLLVRLEAHRRRLPAVEHPLISLFAAEGAPEVLGGASLAEVFARHGVL